VTDAPKPRALKSRHATASPNFWGAFDGNSRGDMVRAEKVPMISVIIPTLNAEGGLAACLTSLVHATVEGVVREVIVVDGGSTDRTAEIVDQSGATLIRSAPGRGSQLRAGAEQARMPWLLFLHADTVLEPGWERDAGVFIDRADAGADPRPPVAAFRFALDDVGLWPRLIELGVAARCAIFRLPYGDQGLLIPSLLYRRLGGYKPLSLMEDIDFVRRIGRRRLVILRSRAVTSASRYRSDGYARRVLRNLLCLTLYFLRVPANALRRLYG
jgi:rSAM/selenodomain-associated transferase 2